MLTKQGAEVREAMTELVDVYRVSRPLCLGHFLLYAFTKMASEFKAVSQLLKDLVKETVLTPGDVEEGYVPLSSP